MQCAVTDIRKCFQEMIIKGALSTNYCIELFHTLKNTFQK